MTSPPLTLHLFGALRVLVRGEPLPRVRTRSVEWLLALLVLRHGRAVNRGWLAGTLWPESEERQALQNLRHDLVSLRKALGPESGRIESPARDVLTLDLTGAEVDVLRFDAGVQAGDEEALQSAVELYTAPLLEGCVEEWALAERMARAEQCLAALERLAERMEGRGDHRAAIRYLRRAEAMDPLQDSIARRLMANLAASGDPAAAIEVYRNFRSRLHEELAVQPDEATTCLFREIRAAARHHAHAGGLDLRRSDPFGRARPVPRVSHVPHQPPRPLAPLIGRESELQEVLGLLHRSRLVTLTGGGGVGKTRLALEVAALAADDFAGGALWVELAALDDGARILQSVGAALGIREQGAEDAAELEARLAARLSDGTPLLALDNCEHVLDAVAQVVQTLLQRCPDLRVLATSRQRLGLPGEVVWRVPSLPAPDPAQLPAGAAEAVEKALSYPAVRLFVERAAAAREGFRLANRADSQAVCLICRRLDGIPLAIELAAARARVLTPRQMAERLDDRFNLLTTGARGALPRHQTLRALIDWSYDLLSEAEGRLFRRLAVFSGGWTLAAAEAVCADGGSPAASRKGGGSNALGAEALDLLDSLVDRSLVLAEEAGGDVRYRMLETVREYALDRLRERDEEAPARAAHLDFFLRLAEEIGQDLPGSGQEAALAHLEAEVANFRAALAWAQAETAPAAASVRLAAALWPFWETRGYLSEGRQYLRAALNRPGLPDSPERAQALLGAAQLAYHQFDLDEGDALARESWERFRALGDDRGIAAALLCLGDIALARGDRAGAGSLLTAGLASCRCSGWTDGTAFGLARLARVALDQGEWPRAWSLLEEGLAAAEAAHNVETMALSLNGLGELAMRKGDPARARVLLERSLEIRHRLGHTLAACETLTSLGWLARREGDLPQALSCFEQVAAISREAGHRQRLAWALQEVGNVHYALGAYAQARAAYEPSLAIFRELDHWYGIACASNNLGMASFHLGEPARAQVLHREALAFYGRGENAEGIAWSLERLGLVEARHGNPHQAARLLGAASGAWAAWGQAPEGGKSPDLMAATAALREKLGPEAWTTAWQAGRAMSREVAIRVAWEGEELPTARRQES
jgi:predicted ATPase/DNA-binding SARP family transcriptional activator